MIFTKKINIFTNQQKLTAKHQSKQEIPVNKPFVPKIIIGHNIICLFKKNILSS